MTARTAEREADRIAREAAEALLARLIEAGERVLAVGVFASDGATVVARATASVKEGAIG